jgi:hypothetical protein
VPRSTPLQHSPMGITIRRMMIWIGLLALLIALHTPDVRDFLKHQLLIRNSRFQTNPATILRANHIFFLNTVPSLITLGILDMMIVLACWRRSRKFARAFLAGSFGFLFSKQK